MSEFTLQPTETRFHIKNALAMAMASELAYEGEAKIRTTCAEWGFKDSVFFDDTVSTQGFVAWNDDDILIAFRGTQANELADWHTDLKARFANVADLGRIHRGFNEATDSVWQTILDATQRGTRGRATLDLAKVLEDGGKVNIGQTESKSRIWITGHSLGGALSTVAAQRFTLGGAPHRHPLAGVYTFGQPRVVDEKLGIAVNDATKARYFRFVNNNDLVTRVPTRSMGYTHVGTFQYINTDATLQTDPSYWQTFLDRVTGRLEDFLEIFKGDLVTDGIEDHSMSNGYLAKIRLLAAT